MQQVSQKFADIKRICEDEVDPTKNVKYKIKQLFKMGRIEFEQLKETFQWRFK
jgi:hypothetical protein